MFDGNAPRFFRRAATLTQTGPGLRCLRRSHVQAVGHRRRRFPLEGSGIAQTQIELLVPKFPKRKSR